LCNTIGQKGAGFARAFYFGKLYQVTTGNLNLAIKRNSERFPADFIFQLTKDEYQNLILQSAISSSLHGGSRTLPYVFTEHGVAMLSAVLRSERAVAMSVFIVRAFVKLHESLANNKDLALKVSEIELTQEKQGQKIAQINNAVVQLLRGPIGPSGPVGFK